MSPELVSGLGFSCFKFVSSFVLRNSNLAEFRRDGTSKNKVGSADREDAANPAAGTDPHSTMYCFVRGFLEASKKRPLNTVRGVWNLL